MVLQTMGEEKIVLSVMIGKWLVLRRKGKLRSYFMPKESRQNKHLSMESKTINLMEENTVEYLQSNTQKHKP